MNKSAMIPKDNYDGLEIDLSNEKCVYEYITIIEFQ